MPDVFPRRNLPDNAEPWGREIEKKIVTLEGVAAAAKSGVSGQNRTTAATLADLARQQNRLERLYRSIPKPAQATGVNTGFALSGGWNTVATAVLIVPVAASRADIFAVGSAFLTNTTSSLVTGSMRLIADATASPAQPWATYSDADGFHASITPGYSWGLEVTEGDTLNVSLQVAPDDPATWGAHVNNYATVAAMVTFTG